MLFRRFLLLGLAIIGTSIYMVIMTISSLSVSLPLKEVEPVASEDFLSPDLKAFETSIVDLSAVERAGTVGNSVDRLSLPQLVPPKASQSPPKEASPPLASKCNEMEMEYGISKGDWGRLPISMQSTYEQSSCNGGMRRSGIKDSPEVAFTQRPVPIPGTVDFPCGERELSWMACQIRCTSSECTNAYELCFEDTSCSHVSVLPNNPFGFATLKRKVKNSEEEVRVCES